MKHFSVVILLVALQLAGKTAIAQEPPDFSGVWRMDMSRSESAAQEVPIGPMTITIDQRSDRINIETNANGSTRTVTYLPVGVKSPSGEGAPGAFRWEGEKLVTELTTYVNDRAVNVTEVRTLDHARSEMTVELTLAVQHGYTGPDATAIKSQNSPHAATGRNVFVKVP
jgi:hypothetical protein